MDQPAPSKKKLKWKDDGEKPSSKDKEDSKASPEDKKQHQEGDDEEVADDFDDEFDPSDFIKEERSKLASLLEEAFTDDELKRFEAARRCALNVKEVKRTMSLVLGKDAKGSAKRAVGSGTAPSSIEVDDKTASLMAGLTKMYLAELIERACVVSAERGGALCIQPRHIREAYRRLKIEGRLPATSGDH